MKSSILRAFLALLALLIALPGTAAPVRVRDDAGRIVTLNAPAMRIVSLAPHATEMVFAAGANSQLVGVDMSSDYPEAARQVPKVGKYGAYDLERIISLKPDIVIGWRSGLSPALRDRLARLGVPLFESEPASLEDIAASIEKIGELAGTQASARLAAQSLRKRLANLPGKRADGAPLRVFIQVSRQPLIALGGKQIVSQALTHCGAENIFGRRKELAPFVSREAVLEADPDVMFAGAAPGADDPLADWAAWPQLAAVRHEARFTLDADSMARPGPRLFDAIEHACTHLQARRTRTGKG